MIRKGHLNKATIIILNGHSSAAKTSTIQVLQKIVNEPLINVGIDQFFLGLGPQYFGEKREDGFDFESYYKDNSNTKEKLRTNIKYGPVAMKMLKGIAHTALYYYKENLNVVVDDVIYYSEIMKNYSEVLNHCNVFIFKLYCNEDTLLERERYRFNRALGLGICQQEEIDRHSEFNYDLEIDSSIKSAEEIAEEILEYVNNNNPSAILENINL